MPRSLNELAAECYMIAEEHGFWPEHPQARTSLAQGWDYMVPVKIALIHSELSEALQEHRTPGSDKVGKELVDVLIRLLDLACYLGIDLNSTYEEVTAANRTRPFRHNRSY
jgi:NTP pyrophosphatase (non-canonical NTP hydrolase)